LKVYQKIIGLQLIIVLKITIYTDEPPFGIVGLSLKLHIYMIQRARQ